MDFYKTQRPIINIPVTPLERLFTILSFVLILGNIAYIIFQWPELPEKIPGHFNGAGEVDRWGSKAELLMLPALASVMWLGLTILEKYPHIYNYLNLTEHNAERQYKYGRLLINTLKTEIIIVFVFLNFQSIEIANGHATGLGQWSLPVFLTLIFGTIAIYLYKSLRAK